jgi:lipopolysaccharide biosynthesis glycosyltransferase
VFLEWLSNTRLADIVLIRMSTQSFIDWKEIPHISRATYLRLLIPEFVPERIVVYLDCDTLVFDDISNLFKIDLGHNLVGGVIDPRGTITTKISRSDSDPYLNAGVLLLNNRALSKAQFVDDCLAVYKMYERDIVWQDQCVINKVLEGKKMLLPSRWNVQLFSPDLTTREFNCLYVRSSYSLIHFIGPIKPWQSWAPYWAQSLWQSSVLDTDFPELEQQPIKTEQEAKILVGLLERDGKSAEADTVRARYSLGAGQFD